MFTAAGEELRVPRAGAGALLIPWGSGGQGLLGVRPHRARAAARGPPVGGGTRKTSGGAKSGAPGAPTEPPQRHGAASQPPARPRPAAGTQLSL